MGLDAKLFSTSTWKSFRYDREYHIPVEELRGKGLTKREMLLVLEALTTNFHERMNPLLSKAMDWVETLPEDDIIFSRNDQEDVYYSPAFIEYEK